MKTIKKFEEMYISSEEEDLAFKYNVHDFKIDGIMKYDDEMIVFSGRVSGEMKYMVVNFSEKSLEMLDYDEGWDLYHKED